MNLLRLCIFHTLVQISYFKPCSMFSLSWDCWFSDSNQTEILLRENPQPSLEQHTVHGVKNCSDQNVI